MALLATALKQTSRIREHTRLAELLDVTRSRAESLLYVVTTSDAAKMGTKRKDDARRSPNAIARYSTRASSGDLHSQEPAPTEEMRKAQASTPEARGCGPAAVSVLHWCFQLLRFVKDYDVAKREMIVFTSLRPGNKQDPIRSRHALRATCLPGTCRYHGLTPFSTELMQQPTRT